MATTYTPIATQTIGTAVASVTFGSIPATYTDLILISKLFRPSASTIMIARFNGDSATNYSEIRISGNGTTTASGNNTSIGYMILDFNNNFATPNAVETHFQNYSSTTLNKAVLSRSNQSDAVALLYANLWRSTAAINSIVLTHFNGANFSSGSVFTLYGIKAA
jgi:hypothetical protein